MGRDGLFLGFKSVLTIHIMLIIMTVIVVALIYPFPGVESRYLVYVNNIEVPHGSEEELKEQIKKWLPHEIPVEFVDSRGTVVQKTEITVDMLGGTYVDETTFLKLQEEWNANFLDVLLQKIKGIKEKESTYIMPQSLVLEQNEVQGFVDEFIEKELEKIKELTGKSFVLTTTEQEVVTQIMRVALTGEFTTIQIKGSKGS